jgi:hypothetical protein
MHAIGKTANSRGSRSVFAVAAVLALAAPLACSSKSAGPTKAATPASSGPAPAGSAGQPAATASASAPSPVSQPGPASIGPSDAVLINCDKADSILVFVAPNGDESAIHLVYDFTYDTKGRFGSVSTACWERGNWSNVFSKLVVSADDASLVSHVGYVDLARKRIVDLTALRQGRGPKAKRLDEQSEGFYRPKDRLVYDDSRVVLRARGNPERRYSLSLASPRKLTRLNRPDLAFEAEAGRIRAAAGGWVQFDAASPDGRLIASPAWPKFTVRRTGNDRAGGRKPVPKRCGLRPAGWVGTRTLATYDDGMVYLVTIKDTGATGPCTKALPRPVDLRHVRLGLDRRSVVITVKGAAGFETYRHSLAAVTEPLPHQPVDLSMYGMFDPLVAE